MNDTTERTLWDLDGEPVGSHGVDVPGWIEPDIDGATVAAIVQGGCASGAYMPAVTYADALETMAEHGNDVIDYIDGRLGVGVLQDLAHQHINGGWSHMATVVVSCAVESWAADTARELEDRLGLDPA